MNIKKLTTNKTHLLLFLKDETLLVWSKTSSELYGFEKLSAAIFLYMEGCESAVSLQEVEKYFSSVSNKEGFYKLYMQIQQILTPSIPIKKSNKEEAQHPVFSTKKSKYTSSSKCLIQLNEESSFSLFFPDEELLDYVCESINHLKTEDKTKSKKTFQIALQKEQKGYSVYVDELYHRDIDNKQNLVPALYDIIRAYHYQNHPFLIALHGAVVYKDEKVFIFPGVSGSGKSTLALYLMTHGFTLFSDELCIIDERYAITPLPLGITLKEGSWEFASSCCVDNMQQLSVHKRFDAQNIRYIKPSFIQKKKVYPKKFFFIFPTYSKKVDATRFEEISIIEALHIFTSSQYHLFDDKDEKIVTQWIELLGESKLYTLEYADIKEVENIIKGLH